LLRSKRASGNIVAVAVRTRIFKAWGALRSNRSRSRALITLMVLCKPFPSWSRYYIMDLFLMSTAG
jgi:hypothetical protein